MPRAFSADERTRVRARLLDAGTTLFARLGLPKTTVADLAREAGISKGGFYLFFESKEHLFLAILQDFEVRLRTAVFGTIAGGENPQAALRRALLAALQAWRAHPLLHTFDAGAMATLARRLPPDVLARHQQDDHVFIAELLERLRGGGARIRVDTILATGLIRGLFFLSLHETDFASEDYAAVLETYVDLVVRRLLEPSSAEPALQPIPRSRAPKPAPKGVRK